MSRKYLLAKKKEVLELLKSVTAFGVEIFLRRVKVESGAVILGRRPNSANFSARPKRGRGG